MDVGVGEVAPLFAAVTFALPALPLGRLMGRVGTMLGDTREPSDAEASRAALFALAGRARRGPALT
jgi:hypothetical protein